MPFNSYLAGAGHDRDEGSADLGMEFRLTADARCCCQHVRGPPGFSKQSGGRRSCMEWLFGATTAGQEVFFRAASFAEREEAG